MVDPLSDADRATVAELLAQLRERPPSDFTPQQIELLKDMASFWLGMITVGKFARGAIFIIRWFGWIVALYIAWKTGIWEVILKTFGGMPQ
jgi:hypothetical protein